MDILQIVLTIALDVAPWLLLGLAAAGLLKAFVPDNVLIAWVGGNGAGAVARAAVIGAPLPLCSCGAIPTALMLHRKGAGRGPTVSFLISTPGIGVNSIALSYALLGPVMMLARVLGAVQSAFLTGLLVAAGPKAAPAEAAEPCCGSDCSDGGPCGTAAADTRQNAMARLRDGMRYAFGDLFGDIAGWVLAGIVLAALIVWAVPPQAFATVLTGLPAMLLMALIGVPIYLCATAVTPIAVAMILAGASPGTALVLLLAAPITSTATLAVLRRELGTPALVRYVAGVVGTTVLAGLMLDAMVGWAAIDITVTTGAAQELMPAWMAWGALAVVISLALRLPLRSMRAKASAQH